MQTFETQSAHQLLWAVELLKTRQSKTSTQTKHFFYSLSLNCSGVVLHYPSFHLLCMSKEKLNQRITYNTINVLLHTRQMAHFIIMDNDLLEMNSQLTSLLNPIDVPNHYFGSLLFIKMVSEANVNCHLLNPTWIIAWLWIYTAYATGLRRAIMSEFFLALTTVECQEPRHHIILRV
ncbi:hypothetical protein BGW37DRAFT_146982 [Umbelopsis sp. PMI_123]|nr:hypothetical protein BGW37DRAFT_146982 [Umbelopsis sp. PMI_123]